MLRRTSLRRYLTAVLCSDAAPQTCDCEVGALWTNCDGVPAPVYDTPMEQLDEDAPGECADDLKPDEVIVTFRVERETYELTAREACKLDLNFAIDIVVCAPFGGQREDILDTVQERIITRLFAMPTITDTDGGIYKSPLHQARENKTTLTVIDDREYGGDRSIRTLSFSMATQPCLKSPCCPVKSLCFDFSALPSPKLPPAPPPEPSDDEGITL